MTEVIDATSPARAAAAEYGDRSGLDYNIIDSDAHMSEPAELWQRVDKAFRDQVPRVESEHNGRKGMFLKFENVVVRIAAPVDVAGSVQHFARPGGWDPAERLKDMEIDGVSAAVLYTTHGFWLFGTMDAALQQETFRVYNDWLSEFVGYCPRRLRGLGLISLFDIDQGVSELERCKKLGLSGGIIWSSPPDTRPPYSAPAYNTFWNLAAELNMPIALHTNTCPQAAERYSRAEAGGGLGSFYTAMVMEQCYIQDSLLQLVFGGAFERYPELKIISAEADIGWLPPLMGRANKYYESRGRRGHDLPMIKDPSAYLRENIWHSFIKDPQGLSAYAHAGIVDRIMWSTDYPHPASFFPNSLQVFREDLSGLPIADKRKIVHDNAAALFGFADI